ncbi:MAG TPA: DUF2783 domain-containing protein [Burkholderiaceae bacterium]|nr:DUF2783 domain-containing protein [Burkholderiaceae bacterium]
MSARLNLEPNLVDPDGFYQELIEAHRGLDDAGSQMLNAKLVLILANQVGDMQVLRDALALARRGIDNGATRT